jgi:hypothetical protein
MLKSKLRFLLPPTLCLILSGCNIYTYPSETPADPVYTNTTTVFPEQHGNGYIPDVKPVSPAVTPNSAPVTPWHQTGFTPASKPVNPASAPVTPDHQKGFNPPSKPVAPASKPVSSTNQTVKKPESKPFDSNSVSSMSPATK